MANFQEARVKLINIQLSKSKCTVKNTARTTLRVNKKNFENEELPFKNFFILRNTTGYY